MEPILTRYWDTETWVRSLVWEDPLDCILGQEDPLEEEMQPTSVFLPGESHGQRNLAGYSP